MQWFFSLQRRHKLMGAISGFSECRAPFKAFGLGLLFSQAIYLSAAQASPVGGEVVGGTGEIHYQDVNNTLIKQSSQRLAIDWQQFNLSAQDTVRFQQPSSSATALNRIFDQNPSQIFGNINANGRVYLMNSNGIVFGKGSRVNVNALVASGLYIDASDFMKGVDRFKAVEGHDGSVVNYGLLEAATGGSINLIGSAVRNEGVIVANLGEVNLAAGDKVTMDFDGDGLLYFEVDGDVLKNFSDEEDAVSNVGEIIAEGGQVLLQAHTAKNVFSHVVNNEGVIRATSIDTSDGRIRLVGQGGTVANSGTLDASAKAEGVNGGQIVMQSDDQAIMTEQAIADASATTGKGGLVQVLGDKAGLFNESSINVSGGSAGGEVLIGGDFQGANPDIQNASHTVVGQDVVINADATESGNGGKVIVWADDVTQFYGDISAQGGAQSGNGGFVEVSGKENLVFRGDVNTLAANGNAGTLLLDPAVLIIQGGVTNAGGGAGTDDDLADDLIGFEENADLTTTITEAGLEGLSSDIVLESSTEIRTSGDFTDDILTIGNNLNLTIRTRNRTADGDNTDPGTPRIDLTQSAEGASLEIRMQGTGNLDITSGYGDSSLNGDIAAPITLGVITTEEGSVTVTSNDDITVSGSITTGDISTTGNQTTGGITLAAGDALTVNAALTTGDAGVSNGLKTSGSIDLDAVNNINLNAAVTTGFADSSNDDVVSGSIDIQTTSGTITSNASGSLATGLADTTTNDETATTGDITLVADGLINLDATVLTGNAVSDDDGATTGAISLTSSTSTLTTTTNATLTTGNATGDDDVTNSGNITLSGSGAVVVGAQIQTGSASTDATDNTETATSGSIDIDSTADAVTINAALTTGSATTTGGDDNSHATSGDITVSAAGASLALNAAISTGVGNSATADGTTGFINLSNSAGTIIGNGSATLITGNATGHGTGTAEFADSGAIVLNASGEVRLAAALTTGNAVLTADNQVSDIATVGDITVTSADKLSSDGTTGQVSMSLGSVTTTGSATETDGSLSITTDGGAGDAGGVFVNLTAGDFLIDGNIDASSGNANVILTAATGDIIDAGGTIAGNNINLTATTGAIGSSGNEVAVNAGGVLTLTSGGTGANGDIFITSNADLSVGAITTTATAADVDIRTTGANNGLIFTASSTLDETLTLTSADTIAINDGVNLSAAFMDIDAVDDITDGGTGTLITTVGNLDINSSGGGIGNSIVNALGVNATGNLILQSGGSGANGDIFVTSAADISLATITTTATANDVDIRTTGAGNGITINADSTINEDLVLNSADTIVINGNVSAANMTLDATSTINRTSGTLTATAINIGTTAATQIGNTGTLETDATTLSAVASAGNININNSNNVSSLNLVADSGTINFVNTGSINTGSAITANVINLSSSGVMTVDQNITADAGDVTLSVTGADTNLNQTSGTISSTTADVTLTSDDMNLAGNVSATAGDINIFTTENDTAVSLGSSGSVADRLDLSQSELQNLSATDVVIGQVALTGALAVNGAVDLSGENYDLTINGGALSFANTLTLLDNGTLTLDTGAITSSGSTDIVIAGVTGTVDITSTGSVTLDTAIDTLSAVAANGAIDIDNDTSLTVSGAISSSNNAITLDAGTGTFTNNAAVNAGNSTVQITADAFALNSTVTGTTAITLAQTTLTNSIGLNDATANINFTAADFANLSTNDLTLGAATATGAVLIGQDGAVDLSAGSLDLTINGGATTFNGSLTLANNQILDLDVGAITDSNVGTDVVIGGTTGQLDISSTGAVSLDTDVDRLSASTDGSLDITNTGGLLLLGSVTTNNNSVVLNTGNTSGVGLNLNGNNITGSDVDIDTTGDVLGSGTITANNTVGTVLDIVATEIGTSGTPLDYTTGAGGQAVFRSTGIGVNAGDIFVNTDSADVTLGGITVDDTTNAQTVSVSTSTTGNIFVTAPTVLGSNIDLILDSAGLIQLNGSLTAGSLDLDAVSNINSIVGADLITDAATGSAGTIDVTSTTGNVALSGDVSALGAASAVGAGGAGGAVDIEATAGTLSVNSINTSGGNATVTGNGGNAGAITLTSGASSPIPTNLTATGGTSVDATGGAGADLTFGGSLVLVGNTSFDTRGGTGVVQGAGGNITFNGALDGTTTFAETLGLIAGTGTIQFNGTVGGTTELGAITISNTNSVTFAGSVSAASFTANTGISSFDSSGGTIDTTGTTGAGGAVNIQTSGTLDVGDILTNGGVGGSGNNDGGAVTLVSSANAITLGGDIDASASGSGTDGNVRLDSNSALNIGTNNITGNQIDIDASGNLSGSGVITATSSSTGALDIVAARIGSSGNAINFATPNAGAATFRSTATSGANNGDIYVSAANSIVLGGITVDDAINNQTVSVATTVGDITISTNTSFNNNVQLELDSVAAVNLDAGLMGNSIDIDADTINLNNGVLNATTLDLDVSTLATDTNGSVFVSGTTTLRGAGDYTLDNTANDFVGNVTLAAGDDVSLRDANTLTVATASNSGNLNLTAATVNLNDANNSGDLEVTADTFNLNTAVNVGANDVTFRADDMFFNANTVTSTSSITLEERTAGRRIFVNIPTAGVLNISDADIALMNTTDLTIGSTDAGLINITGLNGTGKDITLITGNTINDTDDVSNIVASSLTLSAGNGIGTVTTQGLNTNVGTVSITDGGNANARITEVGDLDIGVISNVNTVTLLANGGDLNDANTDSVTDISANTINLTANNISNTRALEMDGRVNADVLIGNALTINTSNGASIGDINMLGVGGGDFTATGNGSFTIAGTVDTNGGFIDLDATSNITQNGNLVSNGGNITVDTTNGQYRMNGDVQSGGGNIDINLGDSFRQDGDLRSSGGDITVVAAEDILMDNGAETRSEGGDISYTADESIELGVLNTLPGGTTLGTDTQLVIFSQSEKITNNGDGNSTTANISGDTIQITAGTIFGNADIGEQTSGVVIDDASFGTITAIGQNVFFDLVSSSKTSVTALEEEGRISITGSLIDLSQIRSSGAQQAQAGLEDIGFIDSALFEQNFDLFIVDGEGILLPPDQSEEQPPCDESEPDCETEEFTYRIEIDDDKLSQHLPEIGKGIWIKR